MEQAVLAGGGFGGIFLQVNFFSKLFICMVYSQSLISGTTRLTLEYARLMSVDRESMSYHG